MFLFGDFKDEFFSRRVSARVVLVLFVLSVFFVLSFSFPVSAAPSVSSVVLNSSSATNYTNENLTANPQGLNPSDANVSYDWRKNGTSIAILNMPFDDNLGCEGGTKVCDYSDNENNGTLHAEMSWTSNGRIGGALDTSSLSANVNYLTIADDSSQALNLDTGVTFSAWIKGGDTSGELLSNYNLAPNNEEFNFYLTSNKLSARFINSSYRYDGLTSVYNNNEWIHVAVVLDNGVVKFYENATLIQTNSTSATGVIPNHGLHIGAGSWAGFYQGLIDEILLLDYALSEEQISALYNNRTDLIVSQETTYDEVWQACATPHNNTADGATVCSNTLTVDSLSITLNSSSATNYTNENLTANPDAVGHEKLIYNWKKDGSSIAVLNMPFDGNISNATGQLKDYSGYGNNATLGNGTSGTEPTYNSTGGFDGKGAYEFDGANDHILIPDQDEHSINTTKGFTVEAWVYPTNMDNDNREYIVAKVNSGGGNAEWQLQEGSEVDHSGNNPSFVVYHTGDFPYLFAESSIAMSNNNWYHLVGVYEPGDTVKIYVNGVLRGSNSTTIGTMTGNTDTQLEIGARVIATANEIWEGTIDEVRIYQIALSAEQILAHYNNQTDLIVSNETTYDQTWQVCATPNDNTADGATVCSNSLTIQGINITLNSSSATNYTNENLTANVGGLFGDDKVFYNWSKDGSAFAVLNMPMDGGALASGGKVRDYAGGNNGTVVGATYNSTGGFDGKGAYEFNGSSSYLDYPGSYGPIMTSGGFALSAWIKTDGIGPTGTQTIMAQRDSSLNGQFVFRLAGGLLSYWDYYTDYGLNFNGATYLNDSSWHHVAFVRSNDAKTGYLYVDGALDGTQTIASGVQIHSDRDFCIGTECRDFLDYFNGTIDEVMVFNRSLSAEQISALYNNRTDLIVSQETNVTDIWQACVTPNDNTADGATVCSNTLSVLPTISSVVLNSTSGTNYTNENLTAYPQSLTPSDAKVFYNWSKEGSAYAFLNMPMDGGLLANGSLNVRDYATGRNGTLGNVTAGTKPTYNAAGGYDGKGAYEFDGVADWINIDPDVNISGSSFTVTAWAKRASSGTFDVIFSDGAAATANHQLHIGFRDTDVFICGFFSNDLDTTATYTDTNWHHWACTYDTTGNVRKIYRDGALVAEDISSADVVAGNETSIGRMHTGEWGGVSFEGSNYFHGTIDEVLVFNSSLSAEQISALYSNRTDLIVSNETTYDEVWQACATPNDNTADGVTVCSNSLTIDSLNINLNSSSNTNLTTENLTANPDAVGHEKLIYNWSMDGSAFALLNMPMDGGLLAEGNTKVRDYVGGNNASVTDAVYNATGGYDGKGAYSFDGSGDYLTTGTVSLANSDFTLSAWVKRSSSGGVDEIFSIGDATNDNAVQVRFLNTNELLCTWWGQWDTYPKTTTQYTDTNWHHVVCSYDKDSNDLRIYVDGVLGASQTMSVDMGGNGAAYIGTDSDLTGTTWFGGNIDEVMIFDKTLAPEQISALYNNRTDLIVSNETTYDEVWQACATPNDNTADGATVCSNNLTIDSLSITLNSSLGTNYTSENLTVNLSHVGDEKLFYNWSKNGSSIQLLNMPMDGGLLAEGSTKVRDYAHGINGTVTNAVYNGTGGYDGKGAYYFDGSGDYITLADNPSMYDLSSNDNFTVMAWIKIDQLGQYDGIISKYHTASANNFFIRLSSSGSFNQITFGGQTSINSVSTVTTDTWYHIAAVMDGGTGKIYINGTLDNSGAVNIPASTASDPIRIGVDYLVSPRYFKGHIDEVAIYNRSLSAQQISALYNSQTDLIVSQETTYNETWQVCATPNDETADGATVCSNSLTINGTEIVTIPPCINLTDSSTYNGKLTQNSGEEYQITESIDLCTGTYTTTTDMIHIKNHGITLNCNNSVLQGDGSDQGITIEQYQNTTIANCTITNFNKGIYGEEANNLTVKDSNLTNNRYGIETQYTTTATITNNTITSSDLIALHAFTSTYHTIANNTVTDSKNGLKLIQGGYHTIYNNFLNNTMDKGSSSGKEGTGRNAVQIPNYWNIDKTLATNIVDGTYMGGNYWTNPTGTGWSDTCTDSDGDGLCENPNYISKENQDNLPLKGGDNTAPTIDFYTPANNSFVNGDVILKTLAEDKSGIRNVLFEYMNSTTSYTTLCNVTASPYDCTWQTNQFSNDTQGYEIKATAVDNAGNNATSTINLTIDRDIPYAKNITVTYPTGQTSIRNGQNITLGINASDSDTIGTGVNTTQVNLSTLNSSTINTTMTFASGDKASGQWSWWNISVEINAATGTKYAPIFIYDLATPDNNVRSSDRFRVKIDNDPPTYTTLSDSGSPYDYEEIAISLQIYDNHQLENYIFSSNITGTWTNDTAVTTGAYTADTIGITKTAENINFSYRIYIFDDAGNMNITDTQNIIILGTRPEFTVKPVYPAGDALITSNPVEFNFSYYNATATNCSLKLNGEINHTLTSPANETVLNITKTLEDDTYGWQVACLDSVTGNTKTTAARSMTLDTTTPQISTTYPTATTYPNTITEINYTYTEYNVQNCWYSTDNGATNSTPGACTNITGLISTEGQNTWTIYMKDKAENINQSTITFTQDTTPPTINIQSPTNSSTNDNTPLLNITYPETVNAAWYNLDTTTNTTPVTGVTNLTLTLTTLSGGQHNITAYANDSMGNLNTTIHYFIVDTAQPTITIRSPQNTTYSDASVLINTTITDTLTNIDTVIAEINGTTNITLTKDGSTDYYNNTYTFTPGSNWVTIIANDTAGNVKQTTVYLTIDATPPTIILTSPQNTTYSTTNIPLNIGSDETITTWKYDLNNGGNISFTPNISITGVEGLNSITIHITDSSGNTNSTTYYFTVDTTAPTINVLSPGNTTTNDATPLLNVTLSDAINGSVTAWYNINSTTNTTPVGGVTNLTAQLDAFPDGLHNITIYANDSAGNLQQTIIYFKIDTILPLITVESPDNTTYTYNNITLNASASETIMTWMYNLNNTGNVSFTPNTTITTFNESNILIVYATDIAGNTNSTTVLFTVDTILPTMVVLSPGNSTTNDTTPLLNVTFGETVDAAWYNINSTTNSTPVESTLNLTIQLGTFPDGQHNITIYANDSAGNLGTSTVYFTVDSNGPTINLASPANTTYNTTNIPLNIGSDESITTWKYDLNSGGNISFTPNISIAGVEGLNTLIIHITDSSGNINSTTYYFTVDTTAPTINVLSPGNSTTNDATPLLNATLSDVINGSVTAWYNVNSSGNETPIGGVTNLTVDSLGPFIDGQHNVTIYANDSMNNIGQKTIYFTVDTTAPTINLDSPDNTTYGSVSVQLNIGGSETISTWKYDLNGAGNFTFDPNTTITGVEGLNTLIIHIIDEAGNINSTTYYFTVDTTAPTVTILSPTNSTTNDVTPLLNATFGEQVNYTWYNVNGISNSTPIGGESNLTQILSTLSDGQHNITVYANDSVGNLGKITVFFTVDTGLIPITIVSPTNTTTTDNTPLLNATFDETVNAAWYNINTTTNTTPVGGVLNLTVQLGTFSDGQHNITVYVNDSADNLNSNTIYFTVDTTAPTVTVHSPGNSTTNDTTPLLNVTFSEQINYTWYNVNGATNTTPVGGVTNLTVTLSTLSDGQHNVTVYANDSVGNLNTTTFIFTVDTATPSVTNINSTNTNLNQTNPIYNNGTPQNISINFTSSEYPLNVTFKLYNSTGDLINTSVVQLSSASDLPANYTLPAGLSDGNYTLNMTIIDSGGNSNTYLLGTIVVDSTPPSITIVSPTNTTTNDNTPLLNATFGETVNAAWYSINDTTNSTPSASVTEYSTTLATLPEGSHNITVYANDSLGNLNSSVIYFTVDSVKPTITLISPADNHQNSSANQSLIFNATDMTNMSCTLYMDNESSFSDTSVSTNTNVQPGINTTLNGNNLLNRTYSWYVNCTDAAGNQNGSVTRQLTIDQVPPAITVVTPNTGDVLGYVIYIRTDITDTVGVDTATYNILNASNTSQVFANGSLNATDSWDAEWNSSNYTTAQWDVIFNITANDTLGNIRQISNTFTVDNVNPAIQLIAPPSYMGYYNQNYNLSVIVQDFTLNHTYFNITNTSDNQKQSNISLYPNNNTIHNWQDLVNLSNYSEGVHNISLFAQDGAENTRTLSTNFTIDTTSPEVTFNGPTNNLRTNATSTTFNWTVTDNIATHLYCNLTINNQVKKQDILCTNATACTYPMSGFTWANYNWNVSCMDNATNINDPATMLFIPDWQDEDDDEVHSYIDTLIGNKNNVNNTGISNLNVSVGGNDNLTTFDGVQEVVFFEGSNPIINFSHNFSLSNKIEMANITIITTSTSLVVNLGGQLQGTKTLYLDDNSFTSLCVEDATVSSISEVSANCTDPGEIDFATCIGNSTGVTLSGITCTDEGARFKVENLSYSAIKGTSSSTEDTPTGGSDAPYYVYVPPTTAPPVTTAPPTTIAPPATTIPPISTVPPVTTVPLVTTVPPVTTAPEATAPPISTVPPVGTLLPATTAPPITTAPAKPSKREKGGKKILTWFSVILTLLLLLILLGKRRKEEVAPCPECDMDIPVSSERRCPNCGEKLAKNWSKNE